MQADYINCFVAAVQNVFRTMLNTEVTVARPHVKTESTSSHDVTGIVTLSGDVVGAVALSFPSESGVNAVEALSETRCEFGSDEFSDAIGELANMVSGNAKKDLDNLSVNISIPTVVIGRNHRLGRQVLGPWIVLDCESVLGAFTMAVCMMESRAPEPTGRRQ